MTDRKRSAISGEFVTAEYADTHPDTTVSESRPARAEERERLATDLTAAELAAYRIEDNRSGEFTEWLAEWLAAGNRVELVSITGTVETTPRYQGGLGETETELCRRHRSAARTTHPASTREDD